jgi:hypothetical protein
MDRSMRARVCDGDLAQAALHMQFDHVMAHLTAIIVRITT